MSDIPETDFLLPVTLVVQATQFDNLDRYGITTLTVSRGGIYENDLQFVQHFYQVSSKFSFFIIKRANSL
jgi:hypothetical protein